MVSFHLHQYSTAPSFLQAILKTFVDGFFEAGSKDFVSKIDKTDYYVSTSRPGRAIPGSVPYCFQKEAAGLPKKVLVGIDGGGTHSTAVAAYPDGRIAAVAKGGGANFHNIGVEAVRRHLEEMVDALCQQCGCEAEEICVGMSALDAPADEATHELFAAGTLGRGQLDLQSDVYIALMGFTLGKPGVIVICGTGSMLLMLDHEGRQHAAGGWGYLLGDAGSGYTLAREGLLAVIDASEGTGANTPLVEDALRFFGAKTPRGLIDRVYAPETTPDKLAGFARCVLTRAEGGDDVALGILERNMARLARSAAQLIAADPQAGRVGLYGGIFVHSPLARTLFAKTLHSLAPDAVICPLEYPPELGALIHLLRKRGMLTADVLARMQSTYKEMQK